MTQELTRRAFAGGLLLARSTAARPLAFPDSRGRHFIPHGFVVLTGDAHGEMRYTADDYRRMALMGANFQVIRIFLGKIGGWPGYEPDPRYFEQMDELVALARAAGIVSSFKLTVYDIRGASAEFNLDDWRDLYLDKDGRQGFLLRAWSRIFARYKDDPWVFGYDLLNEPMAARAKQFLWELEPRFESQEKFLRHSFVPLYRRLIDELARVSPGKRALYQPYHVPPPVHIKTKFPCLPLPYPLERSNVVFAPHYYGQDPVYAMERYLADAAASDAPVMFGEYGAPTFAMTDSDPKVQDAYRKLLIDTVAQFDARAIGCVKAWWCGSRVYNAELKTNPKVRTWALFTDDSPTGRTERRYIADVIARPRPLAVAGTVKRFGFDFAARKFEMTFAPDPAKGESEIYIPAGRHYAKGFRIECGDAVLVSDSAAPGGLAPVRRTASGRAADFRWDAARLRLSARNLGPAGKEATLRILPAES